MTITNLKKFNQICSTMNRILKLRRNHPIQYEYFYADNDMIKCTNGSIVGIRSMGDFVINHEQFAFPRELKNRKTAIMKDGTVVIESHKAEWFDNIESESKNKIEAFNEKIDKVVPKIKPCVVREYKFDYIPKITMEKSSIVEFHSDGTVEFIYNDEFDLRGEYGEVMTDGDIFVENQGELKEASVPMSLIYGILKIGSKFIMEQYENDMICFICGEYRFLLPQGN